ncbi:MAG: hypothetical protein ABI792_07460, partial [bacterium]
MPAIKSQLLPSGGRFRIYILIFATFCFTQLVLSQDKIETDSMSYKTESIEVDALKGIERFTPVTFENIKRDAIERKYWMQDLP